MEESIEDLKEEVYDNQKMSISKEEVDILVDEMIKKINKEFKKEIRDEITRNQVIHYIKSNYGDAFKIVNVQTFCENDVNKFKRDCYYWLFILIHKKRQLERIYITI